jgi:protein-disulfide isomerase
MALMRRAALAAAVLAALPACRAKSPSPGATGGPSPSPTAPAEQVVAAELGGEKIYMAEVDRRILETYQKDQIYDLRKQMLDQVVFERLLDREARARGITREELLKREVEAKLPAVTEEDIATRFAQSGLAARGATIDQFRPQIEKALKARAVQTRNAGFLQELQAKSELKVLFSQPRATIVVPADAPALGPATAPVTVVEFLDYQCPYCHQVQGTIEEVLKLYRGKVRFVHRDFPLDDIHPQAMKAARAARCAGDQGKFWEYHRSLLLEEGQQDADLTRRAGTLKLDAARFESCVASDTHDAAIRAALEEGKEAGVNGTPTFFVNGRRMVGGRSVDDFKKLIDEELARS